MKYRPLVLAFLLVLCAARAAAVEQVTIRRNAANIHLAGELIVEARDGGLLLMEADGVLWALQPEEIVSREANDQEFRPLTADQLSAHLLSELPAGFQIHRTANFVFCYDTSPAYAAWCGALYERLYRGFYNYWKNRGWELDPPKLPLAAIIFQSKADYVRYARAELGDSAETIIGYYSLRTNRVVMYDLTGADGGLPDRRSSTNAARINFLLSQPSAGGNVATIIHEATHQLAFNSGMQARYADIPLWVSEGIAMYFETPDLAANRGWRTIGAVNPPRLRQFRGDLNTRDEGSLRALLATDTRFRTSPGAVGAYAEAWSLTYYLQRKHPERHLRYLQSLAKKKPLLYDTPEQRLQEFRRDVGIDFGALESDFLDYMRSVR